ncbi:ABC transporter permease [Heyndrickxia sporothermodurans]
MKFIFKNWWRYKERFFLMIIGALIISTGLSYLVGLSETSKGTVIESLQKNWSATYDIVVRPPNSRSITEANGLLNPNYLSDIAGGIDNKQYETIKNIKDVQVAAPISVIGFTGYDVLLKQINFEPGLCRYTTTITDNNGAVKTESTDSTYFAKGTWHVKEFNDYRVFNMIEFDGKLTGFNRVVLAGIDPVQEAKLVGLDKAVLNLGNGRYFDEMDIASTEEMLGLEGVKNTYFPVLISNQSFVDQKFTYKIEKLDLPYDTPEKANKTMEKARKQNGGKFFDQAKAKETKTYTFTSEQVHDRLLENLTGINPKTGEKVPSTSTSDVDFRGSLELKPGPIDYSQTKSPFPDRWKFAYSINSYMKDDKGLIFKNAYRQPAWYTKDMSKSHRITPRWIGFYDPKKLNLPLDPLTELPMETYRPATAELVLDSNDQPINPPKKLLPTSNPLGFLTQPPVMLTTLDAAEQSIGKKYISAIRVKVKEVGKLTDESQQKLEQISKEIEDKTGLITDITLGSSPQPAIVKIPESKESKAIGWMEQPWVNIGASYSIFKETKIGFSGIILAVMLVAIVYVFATNLVSLLVRRKEFAVLLSLGWRPKQVVRMLFYETLIMGLFVAVLSWIILFIMMKQDPSTISSLKLVSVGIIGLIIYILGGIDPCILALKISPYEAMRTGDIQKNAKRIVMTKGPISMSFNSLMGKILRNSLSIFAISVPTALLSLFLFVTFRLKGVMYTSWLGQYVALEVGPTHYIAAIVALLISILTTAELMWQNISDRKPEIALLKAMGWKNSMVRKIVLFEGALIGLLAAIVGIVLALIVISIMYAQFPTQYIGFILLTGFIPIIVGIIGALLPSQIAVRVNPSQGMSGSYSK